MLLRKSGLLLAALAVIVAPATLACVEPLTPVDAAADAGSPPDAPLPDVGAEIPDAWRADGGPDAGPPAELEAAVDYWIQVGGLRGVAAIAADTDSRVVVTRGMATDTDAVNEHTLFNVASLSKTFTGALALQLAEDGRLDLDAPLEDVLGAALGGVPFRHPSFPDTPVTTRMLLAHTSGLVDDFLFLGDVTTESDPVMDFEEFTRSYLAEADHWGSAEPGTRHAYCNAGYGILGLVVERASSADFRDLAEERLFTPLALDGAGWFLADVELARLATPYAWNGRTYASLPQRNFAFYPATSLMISVSALERWLRGHLELGVLEGTRFLDEASVLETRRAQFPSADDSQYVTWYAQWQGGRRWIGHSGSSYGTSAQMRYQPEEGRLLVLLSNSDAYIRNRAGLTAGRDAIDAILARLDAELDR